MNTACISTKICLPPKLGGNKTRHRASAALQKFGRNVPLSIHGSTPMVQYAVLLYGLLLLLLWSLHKTCTSVLLAADICTAVSCTSLTVRQVGSHHSLFGRRCYSSYTSMSGIQWATSFFGLVFCSVQNSDWAKVKPKSEVDFLFGLSPNFGLDWAKDWAKDWANRLIWSSDWVQS